MPMLLYTLTIKDQLTTYQILCGLAKMRVLLTIGGRCNCKYIKDHAGQCGHELNIDPSFIEEYWHHRWYNRHV